LTITLQHLGMMTQLSADLLLVAADVGDAREEEI
jgi:hypothetical protein